MAVDQRAFEAVVANGPFQLIGGSLGIGQRHSGEFCGARGMAACGCGDKVLGFARECNRFQGSLSRKNGGKAPARRSRPHPSPQCARIEVARLREHASHPAAGCRNTIEEFAAGAFQKTGRHVMFLPG
jgi:hypothetical protein